MWFNGEIYKLFKNVQPLTKMHIEILCFTVIVELYLKSNRSQFYVLTHTM